MKITKRQLRRIIREEAEQLKLDLGNSEPESKQAAGKASPQDLVNWFVEKRSSIRKAGVPETQIASLIAAMDDAIEAAIAGRLKQKSSQLSNVMDRITGE